MNHLDDDVLSAYGLDGTATPEAEAHLAQCEVCRDGVAVFREIDSALRGRETWTTVDQARSQNSRLKEVLSYRRRVEAEERDARTFLARVIASPLKFRNAAIAEKPRLHTEGMVRVLCAEANTRHEQRPKFSAEIAAVAYDVATKLTGIGEREQHNLMGMALREHANALRYLGRFKEALKALDHAEKLFGGAPATDPFDLAIVQLIRATVYMKSERLEEGSAVARAVAAVFRDYGDTKRELSAVMVDALCLLFSGRAREAAETFEQVISLCRASGDARMLAPALNNCATALTDLRDFDRAERYYVEAVTLFDEFGCETEKTRVEWSLAIITQSRGDLKRAAKQLEPVRNKLAQLGLTNDAAIATLQWAETMLAVGDPRKVAEACRQIVVSFDAEGMQRAARHALATLNEALSLGRATPQLVQEVRTYLERLPLHPDETFQASSSM
jgi:tetratricopeptide (TPR) repeat protein